MILNGMELIFDNQSYERLEFDRNFFHSFAPAVVAIYRSRLQLLRAIPRESDLVAMKSLRLRELAAGSLELHSIHLDDHHSLLVELRQGHDGDEPKIVIVRIDELELTEGTSP